MSQKRTGFKRLFFAKRFLAIASVVLLSLIAGFAYLINMRGKQRDCSTNLKQIGLALHNYAAAYESLPPRITVDANGKPLHSWRTLLLPFLEHADVYARIDLSKPWDAPENASAMQEAIHQYHCPSCGKDKHDCQYVAIYGDDTVFRANKGVALGDIRDGRSNTIAVVESIAGVQHWGQPKDIPLSDLKSAVNANTNEVSSHHLGGANALLADAGTEFLPSGWKAEELKAALTCFGSEKVFFPWVKNTPEESLEEIRHQTTDQFAAQGKPVRILNLTQPQDPEPVIDGKDFSKMSVAELKNSLEELPDDDLASHVSARFFMLKATGFGRAELSYVYHHHGDAEAAKFWLQEAIVEEGLRKDSLKNLRRIWNNDKTSEEERNKFEVLIQATDNFWRRQSRKPSTLTLPSNYNSEDELPLIVCLHPSFSSQEFYPEPFRQKLADDFRVAILSLDGSEQLAAKQIIWTEDHDNNFETDEKLILAAISEQQSKFKERKNSRFLLGAFGGGLVACGIAYHQPEKYAGAVVLYASVQVAESTRFKEAPPSEPHSRQRYTVSFDPKRAYLGNYLCKCAEDSGSTVDVFDDEEGDVNLVNGTTMDPQMADQMREKIRWILETK